MIVVGTTLPPWKIGPEDGYYASWLTHAEEIFTSTDDDVRFLVVLELDARGVEVYQPLLDMLMAAHIPVTTLTFAYDDGRESVTTGNRLIRICTGRNLITQWAVDNGASHVLFVDADTSIPADSLTKLLEVDYPIVGGRVPTYCLEGPRVKDRTEWHTAECAWRKPRSAMRDDGAVEVSDHGECDCRAIPMRVTQHMNTAGFLLVQRALFRQLRWRTDPDLGLTDDPCYDADAAALGFPTWVREDCVAQHYPMSIGPVEVRGHDLAIYR